MRYAVFSAMVLLCVFPVFGQESAELKSCLDEAMAQSEINRCASEEASRAGESLNQIYRKLLSEIAKDPEALAKVKKAESSWILLRPSSLFHQP